MTLGGGRKPCTVLVYVYEKRLARRSSPPQRPGGNHKAQILNHKSFPGPKMEFTNTPRLPHA